MNDNGKTKNELGYMPWIYKNSEGNTARYVLGEKGENPLIVIGVNPSTATPGILDNTLRNVKAWSKRLGYDGWMMLNLYPQRATNPDDLHKQANEWIFKRNMFHSQNSLKHFKRPLTIWAAWGPLIIKRPYLKDGLQGLYNIFQHENWVHIGKLSVKGHPHHPLYLSKKSEVSEFDVAKYLKERL